MGSSSNIYTLTWDSTAKEGNYTVTEGTIGTLTVTVAPVTSDQAPVDPTPSTYPMRYSWTGPPANFGNQVPGTRRYAKNARVTVDTGYVQGMEVTVDGTTYVFSGWGMEDFRMPSESVTITGVWTEAANIDEENPPLVDTSKDKKPIVPEPSETDVPDEQPPTINVPDEETPKTDLPDEPANVPDEQPPLVDLHDEQPPLVEVPEYIPLIPAEPEVTVPEEPVPMVGIPQTGNIRRWSHPHGRRVYQAIATLSQES